MSRKAIFRVFALLFSSIGEQTSANAQTTTPFETVLDACRKAREALNGGFASGEQLLAVSKTLRDTAPILLIVERTQGDVLSLKGHLVFDYGFIQACVNNETIYEITDKYAAEAGMRGDKDSANKVRLDTRMVAAGQTRAFEVPNRSGTSQMSCVAEVNRSFSWKIKTIGYQSKSEREYKCNDSVRKGLPSRKEKVSSGERYGIIVSVTNKSKGDGNSVLILF